MWGLGFSLTPGTGGLFLNEPLTEGIIMRVHLIPILFTLAAVTPAKDVWVQADYTGTSSGSSSQPYKHLYDVVNVVAYGDVVRVRPGTYYNEAIWLRSGVTYKSETFRGAKLVGNPQNGSGVFQYWGGSDASDSGAWIWDQRTPVSNATIDGFEITYNSGTYGNYHGINLTWVHHVTIRNCWIHDIPAAGLQTINSDYVMAENNKINDCAWWKQTYCCSGISIFKTQPYDSAGGFHNIVSKNQVFHNYNDDGGSDGNGIIIDTTRWDQSTLVENNVVWNNGGGGIMMDGAWNVTVRYNTVFQNGWRIPYPDIYAQNVDWSSGQWNTVCNNLNIYGNIVSSQSNHLAIKINPSNWSSYAWGNLKWHETGPNPQNALSYWHTDNSGTDTSGQSDVLGDPKFINRGWDANANFRLQSSSPAINRLGTNTRDGRDADWVVRSSWYDMGAYEYH